MKNLMSRVLKVLLAVVVLVILAVAGLVTLVDPNSFKHELSELLFKHTGRKLTIGDIKWQFFPQIGVAIQDISLANKAEFTGQLFQVETAKIKVSLPRLFLGQIVINGLELKNPSLNLIKTKTDITNFTDLLAVNTNSISIDNAEKLKNKNKSKWLPKISINNIAISNVKLDWLDENNNRHIVLNNLNLFAKDLNLADKNILGPVMLTTTVVSTDKNLPLSVNITATLFFNMLNKELIVKPLQVKLGESSLHYDLALDLNKYTAKGTCVLDKLDPKIFLELQKQPMDNKAQLPQKIQGKWNIVYENQNFHINDLDLDFDEGKVNGNMQIVLADKLHPVSFNGSISGKKLAVNKLLSFMGKPAVLQGDTNFNLVFASKGEQLAQVKENLTAALDLDIEKGYISGINIAHVLEYAENTLNKLYGSLKQNKASSITSLFQTEILNFTELQQLKQQDLSAQKTATAENISNFDQIKASANFNNGISNNVSFSLMHADYAANGGGVIDFPKNQLNLLINAAYKKVKDTSNKDNAVVDYLMHTPLTIILHGNIEQPNATLDLRGYLQTALQQLQKTLIKDFASDLLNKFIPTKSR